MPFKSRSLRFASFLWVIVVGLCFAGCNKHRLLDEVRPIENHQWNYADVKSFDVEISDTAQTYSIYINLRHSFQFEWRNLWVNITTTFPNGKEYTKRVNLLLSEPDGHWYGDCLGDNCDMRLAIQQKAIFPLPGTYNFKIAQDMRQNPIGYVKSVGVCIEKSEEAPAESN